jgi:GNAT superfamily N-acetyltransferase
MTKILTDIKPESINSFIEQNLDDFYIKSSEHPNFTSQINEKISWVFAKQADWPSCIFKANFENLNVISEIKEITTLIREEKVPNGWTVGPLTKPANLGFILEKKGFSNVYHQSGMAVNLKSMQKDNSFDAKFIVKAVEDKKYLKNWAKCVSSVFHIKVDLDFLKFLVSEKESRFYIGLYNGKIVSSLLLYLSSGVAGLHAVSTLPDYRNKGYGYEISKKALLDAHELGFRVGVLQASALGEKVYNKLGFQKFCDINSYEWRGKN